MVRTWGALVIVSLLGCRGAPCRAPDVQKVIDDCRVVVAGPSFTACVNAHLEPPASFSWTTEAVNACSAQGQGAFIACMAARSSECRGADGTVDQAGLEALVTSCARARPPTAQSTAPERVFLACQDDCARQLRGCSLGCPTTDWASCAACDTACFQVFEQCTDRC